jgi:hypothetical protein
MDNEALILEITKDCPRGDREDIRQDLRLELLELQAKNTTINGDVLRQHLTSRRDRFARKYKLGGITLAPTDPQTETIGIDEHPAANALCYGGYSAE